MINENVLPSNINATFKRKNQPKIQVELHPENIDKFEDLNWIIKNEDNYWSIYVITNNTNLSYKVLSSCEERLLEHLKSSDINVKSITKDSSLNTQIDTNKYYIGSSFIIN